MKKLSLLIILLFVTSIAFSQSATKNTTTGDTSIVLPKAVAREVVKDILRADSAIAELNLVKQNYKLLQTNLILKDSINQVNRQVINLHEQKEKGYIAIGEYMNNQIERLKVLAEDLNEQLKKEKRKRFFWNTAGTVVIGGLIYGIITK